MKKQKVITEHYVVEVISELLKQWPTPTRQHRLDEIMEAEAKVYVTPDEIAALKKRGYVFMECLKYEVGKFYKVGTMVGFTPKKITMECVSANSRFAEFLELYKYADGVVRKLKVKRNIREDVKTDWQTHEAVYRRQCAYDNGKWSQVPHSYAHEIMPKPEFWDKYKEEVR